MNAIRCALLLLLATSLAVAAGSVIDYTRELPAGYRHSNTLFGNLPGSLAAPHVAWAQPHVLGPLRLLIVMPYGAAHEASELRARLAAEVSLITMARHDRWVNKESGEPAYEPVPIDDTLTDQAMRLLSPAYRYDAIIIGKVRWTVIPDAVREKIIEKVKGGTALVWISPWDVDADLRGAMALGEAGNGLAKLLQATVPLGLLPLDVDYTTIAPAHFAPRRTGPLEVRTGKLGGGNVVWLDYHDREIKPAHAEDKRTLHDVDPWRNYTEGVALTPYVPDDDLQYDYYYSILGKALYNVCGKATPVQVRPAQPRVTVTRAQLPGRPVSFALQLGPTGLRDGTVAYELRDAQARVLAKGGGELVAGTFAPALPRLRRGTYVVDAWALQRGAVLDWASAALTVNDTRYVEAVQPAKEAFGRTEPIAGTVKLAAPLAAMQTASIELWDTYGRLLARASLARTGGAFSFPPIAVPLSRAVRLVAKVVDAGFTVDEAETWVGLPSNAVDDYQFIMWANAIHTRANRTIMHQCEQMGVTGYYDLITWLPRELIFESADTLAQHNLLANPYACHVGLSVTPERKLAATTESLTTWLTRSLEAYRRYGTMAYSTCEECYITRNPGDWDNPEALADYRAYLREQYGTIAKLNEIWGAKFGDFAEIGPISFAEAKTTRQPTRWMEQERHRVDRFNRLYETLHATIQKQDPGARMSLDCTGGMDFDWPRMAKITNCYTQCPLEAFRQQPGNLMGTWVGYYINAMDEWTMRTTPWQYLFRGGTHVHWWPVSYGFTGDLSEPTLCMQQAAEECRELERGAGKLLLASQKRLDPIMILWSNTSYYAGILNPGEITWEAARTRFDNLLSHVGLDPRTVDAEFLESRLTYGPDQRVLILPACQSISRAGVAKIKAFAEAGGLVIADFMPAVVDEYLRPYGQPQAGGEVAFETCAKCQGKKRVEVGNVWQACPTCNGTGQTMKGGAAPSVSLLHDVFDFSQQSVKQVGQGYGFFLKGSPDRREEWGALRRVLIEKAGVRGDVEVQDPLGSVRTDVRSWVFDNGRAMFVGLLPDRALNNPPGEELALKLARKAHVYDVRRHQYLGETDTVRTGLLPAEAKLLACLPERLQGLNVSLSAPIGKPGDVLQLKGSILPATLQDSRLVVRVEVSKEGVVQPAYTRNVVCAGSFSVPLPLALNQAPGTYRVRATEIISGYTQDVTFSVK